MGYPPREASKMTISKGSGRAAYQLQALTFTLFTYYFLLFFLLFIIYFLYKDIYKIERK